MKLAILGLAQELIVRVVMNTKCFEQNSYVGLFDQIAYNIPTRQSLSMHKIKIEKKRDKQYIY